jgi:hypothetical protein
MGVWGVPPAAGGSLAKKIEVVSAPPLGHFKVIIIILEKKNVEELGTPSS